MLTVLPCRTEGLVAVLLDVVDKMPYAGLDQTEPLEVAVGRGHYHQEVVVLVENMISLKETNAWASLLYG